MDFQVRSDKYIKYSLQLPEKALEALNFMFYRVFYKSLSLETMVLNFFLF